MRRAEKVTGNNEAGRNTPSIFVENFFHFLTVLLLFFALLWEQKGLIYLSILLLIMINSARLWCCLSLRGVDASLRIDRVKVFPGEKILVDSQVQNSRLLPVWLQMEVPLSRGFSHSYGGDILSGESGLLWREKITWKWELTAPKRGCYMIGPPSLITGDLLGFFQRRKAIIPLSWITVFPRLVSLNPLPTPLEEFFGKQGAKNPIEDPVYPVATRDYRSGRPARHIHWKASLRHNRLQEKVFEPSSRKKILLAIDVEQFQRNEDEESFEAVLEVAATLAVRLNFQGSSFGLVSNGLMLHGNSAVLSLFRGELHLQSILEALAALQMEAQKTLAEILSQSCDMFRGCSCLYLSCQSGKGTHEAVEILKNYRIPSIFVFTTPGEDIPEGAGQRVFKLDEIYSGSEISV